MNIKDLSMREPLVCSLFFLFLLFNFDASAQQRTYYNVLEQKAVQGRVKEINAEDYFARLPSFLKTSVRSAVWDLGQHSAGEYVEFTTDADSIQVRYKVKGALNMPHMPTIGVSGVDLYSRETNKKSWDWAFGRYNFSDTIKYNFDNIGSNKARIYRLYLPLYNSVEWLEIGIHANDKIEFVKSQTAPIIVYGTSIAHGACASRPGMGWTNILGREFPNEVINLGFSGNGRLEQPILDLMTNQNAAAYILDCIPNLALTKDRNANQLDSLIVNAVETIRAKHPSTPIILAGHSSAETAGFMNIHTMEEYGKSSQVAKATFDKLVRKGVKNLHFVSPQDFGLDVNSTVDYAHPNDFGMMKIAKAYEKVLKKIL